MEITTTTINNDTGCVYEYPWDDADRTALRFHQDPSGSKAGGVGATVWDAGIIVAKYLERLMSSSEDSSSTDSIRIRALEQWKSHHQSDDDDDVHVLELGSGTGVVGLTLARLLGESRTSGCVRAHVQLTDQACAMPLLQRNLELYWQHCQKAKHVSVVAQKLDWLDTPSHATTVETEPPLPPPLDLIVVADGMYAPDLYPHLVRTLCHFSTHGRTQVLLAYERRNFDAEVDFFRQLGEHFWFRPVPVNEQHPEWRSPEDIYLFVAHLRDVDMARDVAGGGK